MLKISKEEHTDHLSTLRLEGRLHGPWIVELEQTCAPLLANGKLALDLEELSFIDDVGLRLLARLRALGVKLLNPSPFVEQILKSYS